MNTETLTWKTPRLNKGGYFGGMFHVSRESVETITKHGTVMPTWNYLKRDGTWHGNLKTEYAEDGGTTFKTLAELINVLCEFEINVVGPDDE